jgi:hypothetical protein
MNVVQAGIESLAEVADGEGVTVTVTAGFGGALAHPASSTTESRTIAARFIGSPIDGSLKLSGAPGDVDPTNGAVGAFGPVGDGEPWQAHNRGLGLGA